ncbi:pyocin knob domain-containing protein [Paenibacillus sp. IHBB 3054]|uniref:pyocin knob domain-containing protein n=1 Tax=Paenibacillus sp. IHBB 3054 TaxID=3425689 RepID=UPI003F660E5C
MPSNTPNLKLYKKNPATDGDDTFNIETMINENLDKIDEHAGDNTRHITTAERDTWSAKETTAGAQSKADAARDAAINTAALDATAKANAARDAAKNASIPVGQKGAAGGVADLDANGKVPRDRSYSSLGGRGGATNLDTAFLAGIWVFIPGATGSPEPSGYGLLENIVSDGDLYDGSTNWIFQIVRMTGGAVYSRIKVNQGVWSAWNLEGGDRVFKTKSIVDVDYNLLTTTGIYQIYGIIPPNAPPLTAPWGILNVYMGSNGYIVQEATQTTAPYGKFYRTRTESDWWPWQSVAVQGRDARFDGVDGRNVQNFRSPTDAPSTYPGGESIFFVNNVAGWPALYGTVSSTRGHTNTGGHAVHQYFYPYVAKAPIKVRYSTINSDTWGEWENILTSTDAKGFARTVGIQSFGNSAGPISTTQFIDTLAGFGAFSNEGYWSMRGSWSYGANKYIADSGFGNIPLAGAFIEVVGSAAHYTIRVTTATSSDIPSAGISSEFVYVNNGPTYNPGWRKLTNSTTAESADSFVKRSVPSSGENLNDKISLGMYGLGASANYVNGPGLDWCLLNVFMNSIGYIVQEATNVGTPNPQKRFRTRTEAGVWSRWVDVVTTDSTGKIPNVAANRAVGTGIAPNGTSPTIIAGFTTSVDCLVSVKATMFTDALRTVSITVTYVEPGGQVSNHEILPVTQMQPGRWSFISPLLHVKGGTTINTVGQTPSAAGNAWISAVMTEEG